ncbi:venom carboxylesterase-6-like [Penaeus japonicus]|uniref:venom carboxylesterase-6-like n=1 Tax=Penaeus japonicus TaxID=27405 RepID=UPI001C714F49|nr:venom carboxylesterase-6-like [Penaeus japonicus]
MNSGLCLCVAAALLGLAWAAPRPDRPLVQVAQGKVLGEARQDHGVSYLAFEGIPFAKPPTHSLRFKDPRPAEAWEGELDASQLPPPCAQFVLGGREDCLYLNVYTPQDALSAEEPLPVMVFIHGGGYYMGAALNNHGFQPMVANGVIVVAMQYRLGVLGFLSTEDSAAPGNLGLKDQTLALQWVKDNIASFRGDSERVTLYGGSAGAASVHYQMLAPSAAGLFNAAILQSGSSLCPFAEGRNFLQAAQKIALRFDCPIEPSEVLVTCLQSVNFHLLDEMYFTFFEWNVQPFTFAPRVDGEFIPDEPVTLLREGLFHHVPVVMGINANEMALQSVEMFADKLLINNLEDNFEVTGPVSLGLFDDEEPLSTAITIYDYYLGGVNLGKENADNITKMFSDGYFLMPHDWLTMLLADQVPVYTYELQHRGQHGYTNYYLDLGLDLPQAAKYVAHGDNKQYNAQPGYGKLNTTEDIAVGTFVTTMWTNFAKTKNPTPDDSLAFTWEKASSENLRHLAITSAPAMEGDQRAADRAFWQTLPLRINKLMNQ